MVPRSPACCWVRTVASEVGPWLLHHKLLYLMFLGQVWGMWLLAVSPNLPISRSPGKAMRKGTGFVLRSNSMMSFSQSGKCLSWQGACHILVKYLRCEASLVNQPMFIQPFLQLVPTLAGLIPSLCGWTALKRYPGAAGCCKVSPVPS